ncbi:MAG: serine/threonine protein kinase [Planctomycetota bacterium]|jgi:serine/threonine-protein kinase
MTEPFFSYESSDEILARVISAGIGPKDSQDETTVELFLKTAVIDRGYASADELLDCLDTLAAQKEPEPLATALRNNGVLEDRQLGELLKLFIESTSGENTEILLKGFESYTEKTAHGAADYAGVWAQLEKHEREHGVTPDEKLMEILLSAGKPGIEKALARARKKTETGMDDRFIGKRIGPCEIIEPIDEGGMGVVYKARHVNLNKIVAVKILSPELLSDAHRKRFLREARAAASLDHPNIVVVYDTGEENGYSYIVMQLVEGKSVRAIIEEKGKFRQEEALLVMEAAAKGLKAAHDEKLVHRDLKPDNIMITPKGEVKVMDFGLAKDEASIGGSEAAEDATLRVDVQITAAGMIVGTPLYMSPEQFEGEGLDARSDIYSLGVTFYHMLAGRPPFTGDSITSLTAMHAKMPVPPLDSVADGIHPEIQRIVYRMLEKDPADRYLNADELIADLRKVFLSLAEKEALSKYTYIPKPEVKEPKKRNYVFVATMTAGILLIVILAAIFPPWKNTRPELTDADKQEIAKQVADAQSKERKEEQSKRMQQIMERFSDRIKSVVAGIAAEKDWEEEKTEKVQNILLAYIDNIRRFPFGRSGMDNSSDFTEDGRRKADELLRETRAKLLEVLSEEEADEVIRKALDFRRMGPSPRGGRSRRGGKHHREPPPFPAPGSDQNVPPSRNGDDQSK